MFSGMKTYELIRGSGPESLVLTERPVPVPGPRELLLKLRAVSLNDRMAILRDVSATIRARRRPSRTAWARWWRWARRCGASRWVSHHPGVCAGLVRGGPTEENTRRRLGGPLDGLLREYAGIHEEAAVAAPRT